MDKPSEEATAESKVKGEAEGEAKGEAKGKAKGEAKAKAEKAKGKAKTKPTVGKAKAKAKPRGRPKGTGKGKARTVRPLGAKARVAVAKAKWHAVSKAETEATPKKKGRTLGAGEYPVFAGRRPPLSAEPREIFLAMRWQFYNLDRDALQLKTPQQHDFFHFVRAALGRDETLPCAVAAYVECRMAQLMSK